MKLYRSLVYRELRLTRKRYALMFILFVLLAAMFALPAFRDDIFFDDTTEAEKYIIVTLFTIIPAAIGSFIAGSNNGVHKSDINTGWKRNSVTLPATPVQKAGADLIVKLIVFLLFLSEIASGRLYGEQFKVTYDKVFNVVPYITSTIVLFAAWVVGNWSICTLLDGEGTMRNICVYSAYALVPFIAQRFINVALSHILIRDEYVFMQAIEIIGTGWTLILLFSAIKSVHQYSFGKTVFAIILTICAMLIMLVLLVLFMSLIQQIFIFASTIYTELSYRIRV